MITYKTKQILDNANLDSNYANKMNKKKYKNKMNISTNTENGLKLKQLL